MLLQCSKVSPPVPGFLTPSRNIACEVYEHPGRLTFRALVGHESGRGRTVESLANPIDRGMRPGGFEPPTNGLEGHSSGHGISGRVTANHAKPAWLRQFRRTVVHGYAGHPNGRAATFGTRSARAAPMFFSRVTQRCELVRPTRHGLLAHAPTPRRAVGAAHYGVHIGGLRAVIADSWHDAVSTSWGSLVRAQYRPFQDGSVNRTFLWQPVEVIEEALSGRGPHGLARLHRPRALISRWLRHEAHLLPGRARSETRAGVSSSSPAPRATTARASTNHARELPASPEGCAARLNGVSSRHSPGR
jgi:hypothetical protein